MIKIYRQCQHGLHWDFRGAGACKCAIPYPADMTEPLTVFFDGACPLCQREIAYYQRLDRESKIRWVDVASSTAECPDGYCQRDLLRRFHVQCEQGHIHSGAAGFARMWAALPGVWRYVGKVALWPPITALLELAYKAFLPLRPWMQQRARALLKRP